MQKNVIIISIILLAISKFSYAQIENIAREPYMHRGRLIIPVNQVKLSIMPPIF